MKKKVILGTIVLGLAWLGVTKAYHTYLHHPRINPKPKYYLTVKGHIDPSLKHRVKLTWIADYETTNPKCEVDVNWLEGGYIPREKFLLVKSHPDKQGNYQDKIPLNYYLRGYCGWQLFTVGYKIKDKKFNNNDNVIDFFSRKGKGAFKVKGFGEWRCTRKSCSEVQISRFQHYSLKNNTISSETNYEYILNFKGEKK